MALGKRPANESAAELGFAPRRRMISWFDPRVLLATALRDVLAATFGTYADKRDQQAAITAGEPLDLSRRDEAWFDLVADIGEAFGPTHAVAWHLAQPQLDIDAHLFPRADLVVLCGDTVYPAGSIDRYENQFIGPYAAAFPEPDDLRHQPWLFALPGNHDWYDGLTAFLRVFCQGRSIGGWRTRQRRSYFHIPLPQGWHIWAVDTQLGGWLDRPQVDYFLAAAEDLRPTDRIILVCASPAWINVKSDPTTHETIDYVRRKIVRDRARIALYVSGDWHHYARYEDSGSEPEQRVTLGLGGAFLHPTHHLPNHIDLIDKRDGKTSHLTRKARWPSTDQSRWRSLLVVFLAPLNPVFALFMGFVQFGFAWLVQAGTRRPDQSVRGALSGINMRGIIDGLVRSPLALLLAIAMVVAFTIFAKPAKPSRALLSRLVGGLHGAAQVALAAPVVYLAKDVPGSGLMYGLSFAGAVVLLGGFMSATLVGWYFLVTHTLLGMHDNEAFSALRLRSFKGFVRCHIAASGDLTLYPIGIPQVRSRRWRLNSLALPGTSWFSRPVDVRPILIEPPVDVR